MSAERRIHSGVAIVTSRPRRHSRCVAASVPARLLAVQPGPSWPAHRPPLVLDTIGLPVADLVVLLANPPQLPSQRADPGGGGPQAKVRYAPLIAFADAQDWRTLRLLALCPAVRLICPDDPTLLRRWLPPLACARWNRAGPAPIVWLLDPPPDLRLEPLLLKALAVLPSAPSLQVAAARCGVSESTLARVLRTSRAALGLPGGDEVRFRPDELAAAILERLGCAVSLNERYV